MSIVTFIAWAFVTVGLETLVRCQDSTDPSQTKILPDVLDQAAIAAAEENGASPLEIARMRHDLAWTLVRQGWEPHNDSTRARREALEVLLPALANSEDLLASDEGAQLATQILGTAMSLEQGLENYENARQLAAVFLNRVLVADRLTPNRRLVVECDTRLATCDLAAEEGNWEMCFDELSQVLDRREELLSSDLGATRLWGSIVQSIRYRGMSNRFDEIRKATGDGIEWLEAAKCVSDLKRAMWQGYLIDQALDFTDRQACPSDVEYWRGEARKMRTKLIERNDLSTNWVIGELYDHAVRHALETSPGQANQALKGFREWLRSDHCRAARDGGGLGSYVIATIWVLEAPEVGGEEFLDAYREANLLLDEIELALQPDNSHIAALRERLKDRATCQLGKARRPTVGQEAPAIRFVRVADGTEHDLSDLRGKVVLLDFWHARCGACIAGFPHLAQLQSEFSGSNVEIIGCTFFYDGMWSTDGEKDKEKSFSRQEYLNRLREFAAEHDARHPLVVATDKSIEQAFGLTAMPTAFLIDREGIVRGHFVGDEIESDEVVAAIEALIADQ